MKKIQPRVLQTKKTPYLGKRNSSTHFPIVAVGASAGGLDAFTQLLNELPSDTGMSFVLIQHLDPTHTSLLSAALSKSTQMPVSEIVDGSKPLPNQVHVIPAGSEVSLLNGTFVLLPRSEASLRLNMAIDFFFQSLALDSGSRAIGVVLSGSAQDGTEGLRAIKSENGVTLAQDPKSAKFSEMPQCAVNSEVVDFCLPITELSQELVRLAKLRSLSDRISDPLSDPKHAQNLNKVFVLLRNAGGVDFTEYKAPTIRRRLVRRMALLKIEELADYVIFLQSNPEEVKTLGLEVLIHVTSFFRDNAVFSKLQETIFPEIIKHKAADAPIRIWVAGCSSGEEVYSLAIALMEFLEMRSLQPRIQLFGSDLSERMVEKARAGVYSDSLLRDISSERLNRFFVKVDGGYRISKQVRDVCVFVRHDLARDPPFSKLDLVTCRNVLIYFEPVLQKRIISTFHYCLNHLGFLLLGRAENISNHSHFFKTVDKKNKLFSRTAVTSQLHFSTLQNTSVEKNLLKQPLEQKLQGPVDIAKQVDTLLLAQYAPAGVIVNEAMEVTQYRGKTSIYLEHPSGKPQLNLFKMVREGLFTSLKTALSKAQKKMKQVRTEGIEFEQNGVFRKCNLVVIPVVGSSLVKEQLFLVLFETVSERISSPKKGKKSGLSRSSKLKNENASLRASRLEHELRSTQEYLQSLNDEHQKTNETLNSVNEEFVSGNEELQSMNEELETAKEELQSTNEELTTVNDELQNRNHEIGEINDDLINLLNSAEIPILILDLKRRIRRFTPRARKLMNLLPTDVGRLIDDIKPSITIDNLEEQIQEVIENVTTKESEVQDKQGKWYRIQIRPYKTIDQKIAGVVLSLVNTDLLRRAVIDAEWVRDYSESIVEAVQIPLLVLDGELKIISANQMFFDCFQTSKLKTEGKVFHELVECEWEIESLKQSLSEMIEKKTSFQNEEVECKFLHKGQRVMSLSARPIQSREGLTQILLALEDITERKAHESDRRELLRVAQEAKAEADKANLTKDLFLATLSHELRTPLTSMILQVQMLQRGTHDEERIKRACVSIERAARMQAQLIEDLLDVSRIVTGNLKMERVPVDLKSVILSALETVTAVAESKAVRLESDLGDHAVLVSGDSIRLQQVIWNLLTNAIKFTSKCEGGDRVQVFLKEVEGEAEIRVVDTGIGIEADFLPLVFNRFSQAEATNTRTHGGLGLGLAIVRHLVEMHEGTVKVESLGKDKGSVFTITLPLMKIGVEKKENETIKSVSTLSPTVQKKLVKTSTLSGPRILVVEDDLGVREALTEMLGQAGAQVRSASSGKDALEILKEFAPDEMVVDIAMPEEDGYALFQKIRKVRVAGGRLIPALALTALASDQDRERSFSAGFQEHLVKPFDCDRLTRAILELKSHGHSLH